jgi:hypothetical protein
VHPRADDTGFTHDLALNSADTHRTDACDVLAPLFCGHGSTSRDVVQAATTSTEGAPNALTKAEFERDLINEW